MVYGTKVVDLGDDLQEFWDDIRPRTPPKPPYDSSTVTVWLGLLDLQGVELKVPGYSRVRVTRETTGGIQFATMTAACAVGALGIFLTHTGDDLIFTAPLGATQYVHPSDTLCVPENGISFHLDGRVIPFMDFLRGDAPFGPLLTKEIQGLPK